jgi:hypothetical protein
MPRSLRRRRLAIPRRLVVGGRTWRIRQSRTLRRREGAVGLCNSDDLTIQIDPRQTRLDRERTFLHEVLHACLGSRLDEAEERLVLRLEAPLHSLLISGQLVAVPDEVP